MKSFIKVWLIGSSLMVIGCTAAEISSYETDVRNVCSIADGVVGDAIGTIPAVGSAVNLIKSSCDTEEAIQTLVSSPTSVAWVNTLITTVKSKGTVIPPAPISLPATSTVGSK